MKLYSDPGLDSGEFKVAMNPGGIAGKPFGVITLGPDAELHIDSDEDADRLIRAAVQVKEYRARIGVPHEWKSRNGLCEFCGSSKGTHREPAPALEGTVTAPPQDAPYAEVIPAGLVGRLVEDACDDSPCPVVGKVIGQIDEDTVEVLWGDRRFAGHPGTGTYEPVDALRPAREASRM